jgi:hypothetical protein
MDNVFETTFGSPTNALFFASQVTRKPLRPWLSNNADSPKAFGSPEGGERAN